jgi:hypothetical protein
MKMRHYYCGFRNFLFVGLLLLGCGTIVLELSEVEAAGQSENSPQRTPSDQPGIDLKPSLRLR